MADPYAQLIKDKLKTDNTFKNAWNKFCDQTGGGFRDPNWHPSDFLQNFINQYSTGALQALSATTSGGSPSTVSVGGSKTSGPYVPKTREQYGTMSKEELAEEVKIMQRGDRSGKAGWVQHCDEIGGGFRDPYRHDLLLLRTFWEKYATGAYEGMTPVADTAKGGGKSKDPHPGEITPLVSNFKEAQRCSPNFRSAWTSFREQTGGGFNDPAKAGKESLFAFMEFLGQSGIRAMWGGFGAEGEGSGKNGKGAGFMDSGTGMSITDLAFAEDDYWGGWDWEAEVSTCWDYYTYGSCSRGDACQYKHTPSEKVEVPWEEKKAPPAADTSWDTIMAALQAQGYTGDVATAMATLAAMSAQNDAGTDAATAGGIGPAQKTASVQRGGPYAMGNQSGVQGVISSQGQQSLMMNSQTAVMGQQGYMMGMQQQSAMMGQQGRTGATIMTPARFEMINKIKAFQRQGDEAKLAWQTYCETMLGTATRDPSLHTEQALSDFVAMYGL